MQQKTKSILFGILPLIPLWFFILSVYQMFSSINAKYPNNGINIILPIVCLVLGLVSILYILKIIQKNSN